MLRPRTRVDRIYIGVAVCLVACLVLHIFLFFQMRQSLLLTQLELVAAQTKLLDLTQQLKAESHPNLEVSWQGIKPALGQGEGLKAGGPSSLYVPIDPKLSCESRFGA